jgi:hypothetical protein
VLLAVQPADMRMYESAHVASISSILCRSSIPQNLFLPALWCLGVRAAGIERHAVEKPVVLLS